MKQINKALGIRAFISICIVGLIVSCASTPKTESSSDLQPGNSTISSKYAIYAMMAANSYHDEDKIYFPIKSVGWQLVDLNGKPTTEPTEDAHWFTGLSYDIFERQGSNEVVIAIRGTDSKWDYVMSNLALPISIPYKQASNEVGEYVASHPNKKITITGHSLGGGIALHVSVDPDISSNISSKRGLDAITFDSSPRIFDGLGDHHNPSDRVLIFQDGEVLESFRDVWIKIYEVVPKENIYWYSFDFKSESSHRGDCLAYGLLKSAATVDPEMEQLLSETNKSNKSNKSTCLN